jgi:hypothetical protein
MQMFIVTIEGVSNPTRTFWSTSGVNNFIGAHWNKTPKVLALDVDLDDAKNITGEFVEAVIEAPFG